jgi:hemoglobin
MIPVSSDRAPPPAETALSHPMVDRAFIAALVRDFYGRIRSDNRLGPIFASEIRGDWEPHLEKMTDFWCSVILKNGAYSGRPVPAHLKLKQVREDDFDIWLSHFRNTAADRCPQEVAEVFIDRAERIAQSLKFAMFFRLERPAGSSPGRRMAGSAATETSA